MSGFRKLPFETNNEKSVSEELRVRRFAVRGHPGGNLLQSALKVSDTWVKVVRMEQEKVEYHLRKSVG